MLSILTSTDLPTHAFPQGLHFWGYHPSCTFTQGANMRYNPRTDNAMDMDEIARQCMAAVIKATTPEDSRFTARGPGSVGEPWCKLQPLF